MNGQLTIPKRIIQTGKTRDLSQLEQAAVANLTLLNPDFEYLYFDDAAIQDFLAREFPEYRSVFAGFRYNIQRIDFFRYLAVYRLGGFYFDLDVFLSRGIAELTSSRCVFPFEELTLNSHLRDQHQIDWEIGNYAFGAVAGHPFLGAVIENCIRAQKEPQWVSPMVQYIPAPFREGFHVLNSTGPGMLTRTMVENPAAAKDLHVLFPKDVCDERAWHKFGSYGVHLMAASWRLRGNYLKRRLGLLWESRTRRRLLKQSLKLGQKRTLRTPLAAAP